jgi:ketosteroid isomerase-like protein
VRGNWTEVLRDVPNLRVEIPAAVQEGETIWSEWRAYGTSRSGAALELRGVFIFGVRDGRVAWSRMYFEPVEQAGSPLPGFLAVPLPPPLE